MLHSINSLEFIAMVERGVPIEVLEKRMMPEFGLVKVPELKLEEFANLEQFQVAYCSEEHQELIMRSVGEEIRAHGGWDNWEEIRAHGGWDNYSHVGFIGRDESLLKIIYEDEESVKRLGVTHDEIAGRIKYFINEYLRNSRRGTAIIGQTHRISDFGTGGEVQDCPWLDGADKYGHLVLKVENLNSGEALLFPGLIVHLIEQHHFYEGKQSPYRVEPANAVKVLGIK